MRRLKGFLFIIVLLFGGCALVNGSSGATIPHPDNPNSSVEYFVERPTGRGPWPTVILLHGHQGPTERIGGKAFSNWGVLKRFADKGYLAVSVSLPGYGASDGPEDFAGPFTQHAVEAVIAKLVTARLAEPDKILIQGVSLGAVSAALVASRDQKIKGLVLISGLYDFPSFFSQPKSAAAQDIKAALIQQTGGTEEALRARSALLVAANIRAATLIINGAKDDRTDPAQAEKLAAAINAGGGRATVHIYPNFGHEIPFQARDAEVSQFIAATLGQ